jgi:glyoxylase-like metal-dependent hydrolase (beta-lactamase superfamily II)
MRIHAIQTGTVAVKESQRIGSRGNGPVRLINTMLDSKWTEPLPIYAWVIEHPEGPIVIDTGETARTSESGYLPWWHPYFKLGMKANVTVAEEIGPQLRSLNIPPESVRWVVMTHLHTDHAGGLYHFPDAEILVSRTEYEQAAGFQGQLRGYLSNHWPGWFTPTQLDFVPQPLEAFPKTFLLTEAGDVVLVPTPGHTAGHISVILREGPLSYFFAGDVSYTEQTMLDLVVDGVSLDRQTALKSLKRTRHFAKNRPTVYLPSHDPASAERLVANRIALPEEHPALAG